MVIRMWEGSYGKEPFDLRLTVLRLIRNLDKILALTIVGTLLFGGGYYVKNVLLRPEPEYSATSTYKVEYVQQPTQSGDYYINEVTWDTLVHTQQFLERVLSHFQQIAASESAIDWELTTEELSTMIRAKLPSDWHVPTTTIVTDSPEKSVWIARAVEQTMINELVGMMQSEVKTVAVIDGAGTAVEVPLDVRPLRAFVLSALLSFFFVTVVFLLKEIGADSIWLPATLRRRYGLAVLGTIKSPELSENIKHLFEDKSQIAVCSVDGEVNPTEVVEQLQQVLADETQVKSEQHKKEWTSLPAPLLCPETCVALRKMDGVLLVVKAGAHVGKPLEYVLEYMQQQDCRITAAILWEADETLIKAYYCLPDNKDVYFAK